MRSQENGTDQGQDRNGGSDIQSLFANFHKCLVVQAQAKEKKGEEKGGKGDFRMYSRISCTSKYQVQHCDCRSAAALSITTWEYLISLTYSFIYFVHSSLFMHLFTPMYLTLPHVRRNACTRARRATGMNVSNRAILV